MKYIPPQYYRLLEFGRKYLHVDLHYFIRGGTWLVSTQAISMISSLLLAIAFANLLPKEAYGNYKYILSVAGIFGAFSLAGFNTSIIQSVARGYEGIVRRAVRTSLLWSVPVAIFSLAGALYYFLQGNNLLSLSLVAIAIFQPIINSFPFYGSLLNGRKDYPAMFTTSLVRTVFPAAVTIAVLYISKNPFILVLTNLASNAVVMLALYFHTMAKKTPNDLLDEGSISYGKHLSVMTIMTDISNKIDSIIIFHFLGAAPLAVYAFAVAIPDQIMGLLKNLHHLALPKFSARTKEEIRAAFWRNTLYVFLAMLPVFLLYELAAPYIYSILFPQYTDAIFYTRVFAVNILLVAAGSIGGILLDSQVEIKLKYFLKAVINPLYVILMIILIIPFGLLGVMVAEIITRAASFLLTVVFLRKI